MRHNDPLQAAISDPHDKRLDYLLEFGDMALEMAGTQGKRIKQFSIKQQLTLSITHAMV